MTLRQPETERKQLRIPINDFSYDPDTRKFRYLPTGQVWKRAGVDAVVGPVEHQGLLIRATEWLKCYGERR